MRSAVGGLTLHGQLVQNTLILELDVVELDAHILVDTGIELPAQVLKVLVLDVHLVTLTLGLDNGWRHAVLEVTDRTLPVLTDEIAVLGKQRPLLNLASHPSLTELSGGVVDDVVVKDHVEAVQGRVGAANVPTDLEIGLLLIGGKAPPTPGAPSKSLCAVH